MKGIITVLSWILLTSPVLADQYVEYAVTSALQGKIFNIAGLKFKAVRICDVDTGDIVVFQGNPYNCFQISFYNRNKANYCTVYCPRRP